MTIMKITDKMADAVLNAQPTQTLAGERLKITSDVHDRVCAGLQNRGLVEYAKVTENMSRMVLSADGVKVLRLLKNQYYMRSFDLDCGEEMISILAGETQPEPAAEPVQEQTVTISLMVKQAGSSDGFVVDTRTVPSSEITSGRADLIAWANRNSIPCSIGRDSRWIYYVTQPVISTRSAMNGKIYRSDGSVSPTPPAHSGRANVREVSKVLKAAGFTPRNGERIMARSGYQASQGSAEVSVRWRDGADTDALSNLERDETRAAMNDAYAAVLAAGGYPVGARPPGGRVYVVGPKRKS